MASGQYKTMDEGALEERANSQELSAASRDAQLLVRHFSRVRSRIVQVSPVQANEQGPSSTSAHRGQLDVLMAQLSLDSPLLSEHISNIDLGNWASWQCSGSPC